MSTAKHFDTTQARREDGLYACPQCPKVYESLAQLRGHLHIHTPRQPCEFCHRHISNQNMARHLDKCAARRAHRRQMAAAAAVTTAVEIATLPTVAATTPAKPEPVRKARLHRTIDVNGDLIVATVARTIWPDAIPTNSLEAILEWRANTATFVEQIRNPQAG